MAYNHDELIQNIIELSNGTIDDQLKACNKLSKIVRNIDAEKTEIIMPLINKYISSDDCRLQKNGLNFMTAIININAELVKNVDSIQTVLHLLKTSTDQSILKETLNCILLISDSFSVEMTQSNTIPQLIQLIKKNNSQASYKALQVLKHISNHNQTIPSIIKAESIQFLVNILESKNIDSIKEAIEILTNIVSYNYDSCKAVLNYGTLDLINTNLNHPALKMSALKFIDKILYTEDEIDEIIDKCIILSILKVLSSRDGPEVKNIAVEIITTVIEKKPFYSSTLMENDIISLLSDQLENENFELLVSSLSALKSIVDITGCPTITETLEKQLRKLQDYGEENVRMLSLEILNSIMENSDRHQIAKINIKAENKVEKSKQNHDSENEINAEAERPTNNERCKSSVAMVSNFLIDQIIHLAKGNEKDQWESIVEINYSLFTKELILESGVVSRLLSTIVKFINSRNPVIREHGELLFMLIVKSDNNAENEEDKNTENVNFVINSDIGISGIIKLLSSPDAEVVEVMLTLLSQTYLIYNTINEPLKCHAFKQIISCLKKFDQNEAVLKAGAKLLLCSSYEYETNARYIVDAGGIEVIMKLLNADDNSIKIDALKILINIVSCNAKYSKKVLAQNGIMNLIKKFSKMNSFIRLLAYQFLNEITKYGEKQIDVIIAEGFIQFIFQELKDGIIPFDVKVMFFRIFENIVAHKPQYLSHLIQEENLISISMNNLQQPDALIINVLSLLNDIIGKFGYRHIEQTLVANGGKNKIRDLVYHENQEIRELAAKINELLKNEPEIIEIDMSESDSDANEKEREFIVGRKRLLGSEYSVELQTNKRARSSSERSLSVTVDGDEEYDDAYSMISYSTVESNDETEVKPYPLHPPPEILLNLAEDEPTPEFGDIPQNNAHFDPFHYYVPSEMFLVSCCEKIGLNFDRQKYLEFYKNTLMKAVTTLSMPATTLPSNGKSGFGCFSMFLTGDENHAEKIREEIIKYFMDLNKNEILDEEKEAEIRGNSMTNEHLRIIATWWNCKIIVYFDDYWQLFGNWEDKAAPVFVLQKEMVNDQIFYEIVTSIFD